MKAVLYVLGWIAVVVVWATLFIVMAQDYIEAQKVLISQ